MDYAARACWNVQDAEHGVWNNCWRGLNGLFGYDNETPTTIYAVYASYAATDGQVRLATSSTKSNDTVALASIDPTTQITTILIGRFHSEQPTQQFASNVEIQLTDLSYPSQQTTVQITRIPNIRGQMASNTTLETTAFKPLIEPSILISDFQDGDVYVITLHPE